MAGACNVAGRNRGKKSGGTETHLKKAPTRLHASSSGPHFVAIHRQQDDRCSGESDTAVFYARRRLFVTCPLLFACTTAG